MGAEHLGHMDAWLPEDAVEDEVRHCGGGETGGARHAPQAALGIESIHEVEGELGRDSISYAGRSNPHHRDVRLALVESPFRKEKSRGHIPGPEAVSAHRNGLEREEAGLTEDPHQLHVAGPAQRPLHHERNLQGVGEAAQSVGDEGLERSDSRHIDELEFGHGLLDHHPPVLHHARGARVFLEHVPGGKAGLVVERPPALCGKAAHRHLDAFALFELAHGVGGDHVGESGGDAAVGHHRDSALAGQSIERTRVLGHEGDIHHVAAGLDAGLHGLESDHARQGADGQVAAFQEVSQQPGISEVDEMGAHRSPALHPIQVLLPGIRDVDLQVAPCVQVLRDRGPDHARAQHDDVSSSCRFAHGATLIPERWSDKLRDREAVGA